MDMIVGVDTFFVRESRLKFQSGNYKRLIKLKIHYKFSCNRVIKLRSYICIDDVPEKMRSMLRE